MLPNKKDFGEITKDVSDCLAWLASPLQYLKGVGPYLAKLFARLKIHNYEDLLYHLPFRYLDRRTILAIARAPAGKHGVVCGVVEAAGEVILGRKGRKIFEVILSDGSGFLTAKWFHYPRKFFLERFKKGEKFLLFGEVSYFQHEKQMIHPEVTPIKEFFDEEDFEQHLGLIPVYSTTEGLSQRQIRKALDALLVEMPQRLIETLPRSLLEKGNWPDPAESFCRIHRPNDEDSPEIESPRRTLFHRRLAFEEFFYLQLGLAFRRQRSQVLRGVAHESRLKLRQELLQKLPFALTAGQQRAIAEITRDMCSSRPMNRLLQGDVGSGKTLVCLMAMLLAVENGRQAALMAPTELLADQHYQNFSRWLEGSGLPVRLLTASTKEAERKETLGLFQAGTPAILLGTHALLEADVEFENLSLVVIDEQHRFGVRQRMGLMKKSRRPDVLVMTATPIPRSLAMTLYGDLDLSLMTEMPPGRQPIQTRIMFEKNRPKLEEFVRVKVKEGRQAYFVFPLIEESEKLDLKDATRAFEKLKKIFSEFQVEMLHGRMKNSQKEAVMRRFAAGEVQILVATTVIEVGIDVPNATLMVVEHAERFGLSQLHQLRGRVGRGAHKSYCVLATDFKQSSLAKERLQVMEASADGFKIAEEDLKIRGPGDFLGTRQSGLPDFRVGSLVSDLDLLEAARNAAQEILEKDPHLNLPEHRVLRPVLEHRWRGRLGLAQVG
ncbi:MAG TPA: DNA helicase RecG [Deltaproteobacteria bacterium]|nr:DNA helicase RecG [Deltaproteobacteria bacterium]